MSAPPPNAHPLRPQIPCLICLVSVGKIVHWTGRAPHHPRPSSLPQRWAWPHLLPTPAPLQLQLLSLGSHGKGPASRAQPSHHRTPPYVFQPRWPQLLALATLTSVLSPHPRMGWTLAESLAYLDERWRVHIWTRALKEKQGLLASMVVWQNPSPGVRWTGGKNVRS